jgi:hypothetical protein
MPAPALVIANCVQVRILGTTVGSGAANVLHARKNAGATISQATADALGAAIKGAWQTRFAPVSPTSTSIVRVGVRDLTQPNLPEYLDSGVPVQGTSVTEGLPSQVSLCITMRTAKSGKSFTGRVYLGGFDEAQNVAGGIASTTLVNNCTGFIGDVSAALTAQQLTLAIASRPAYAFVTVKTWTLPNGQTEAKTIGRGNARGGGVEPVIAVVSRNNTWETQRRRNNGRGGVPAAFNSNGTLFLSPN